MNTNVPLAVTVTQRKDSIAIYCRATAKSKVRVFTACGVGIAEEFVTVSMMDMLVFREACCSKCKLTAV